MLKIMNDLPDDVLGVAAEGEVTGKDYEIVLIPAFEEKLKKYKKVPFLYHLGSSFTGFSLAAMADDAIVGVKHLTQWERIALVSDHHLINAFAKFFGYMLPGQVRIFKDAELEDAKKWISENSKINNAG